MIKIDSVSKSYNGTTEVLKNVSLTIEKNELLVLLGESGCGKTTLLKMINQLESITKGDILIDGESVRNVEPTQLRRKIGYVVQQVGLFPHLTIKDNIEVVNKIKGVSKEIYEGKTREVMKMIGMDYDEFCYRYPRELSGGQAQRIGVARAYSTDPNIILMDEPFSALDPLTRNDLQNELLRLQAEVPKTIVFVTHDIAEAIKIADRIVLLKNGNIEQVGTPRELLLHPSTPYVSKFLGDKRIWKSPWLITCGDVMTDNVSTVSANSGADAAWELFKRDEVQTAFVVDDTGKVIGKLTEKILMRNQGKTDLSDVMKRSFDYVHVDTALHEAVQMMNEKNILYLPVVNDDFSPVGMINLTDLLKVFDNNVLSTTREVV